MKFGDGSVMVWEAIKEDRTKVLIKCSDRLNFNGYKYVLNKGLLPIYDPKRSPNRTMIRATNPELYHLSWIIVEYAA